MQAMSSVTWKTSFASRAASSLVPGNDSRLVYSTDGGRVRTAPEAPKRRGPAPAIANPARTVPDDGVVRLHRGKPGKGGKPLTLITGLPGDDTALDAILKQLKQSIGAGGSRDGRVLSIQGDHRDRIRERLESLGYRVKLAGG